jgi:hypothetical protein
MDSLSMLYFSVNQIGPYIESDRLEFLKELKANKGFDGFTPDPSKPIVIEYHNAKFLASLHLVLYATKSFLDVYAQLISKLIVPNAQVFGFNEGNVGGKKTKGGRLINWLRDSSPDTYTNATILASAIQDNVYSWIEEAISWRDSLIHHGEIPNLRPMMLFPQCQLSEVKPNDVFLPQMPNGSSVLTYCEELRKNLCSFIGKTIKLLPNIEFSLVNLDEIYK